MFQKKKIFDSEKIFIYILFIYNIYIKLIYLILFINYLLFKVFGFNKGPVRGVATLLGSNIAAYAGGFGMFDTSTSTLIHGYERNFGYDSRVAGGAPPYFPKANVFLGK